jgi:soluble lytic murein transglycosylase
MNVRLVLLSLFLIGAAEADQLPPGVERQGSVVTMQPIADSDMPGADTEAERRPGTTHVLSTADHDLYASAFDAADRGDWPRALALAVQGQNAMARLLVQWRYLQDKNGKAPFAEIDAFLKNNPDWPRRSVLFVRAEEALDPATAPPAVIAWFAGRNPISAIGEIRLGDALIATGKPAWGTKLVREGWAAGTFEPDQELAIVQKDGTYLTPEIDRRRLDNLIWQDQYTAARRQIARVDDTAQRVAAARIALRSDPQRGRRALSELSADLSSDPRLMFDRARAARRRGDDSEAQTLLLASPFRDFIKSSPAAVWNELHIEAREALKDGKPEIAYKLVSNIGLASGSEFADAEFLSGWIALRFLKDAQTALPHFKKLADGVSRPISLSRGRYWMGRAYEALGDEANAWQQYRAAAAASDTFYGQLALARIDAAPVLHLPTALTGALPSRAAFEQDSLVRAMRVLADLGAQDLLRTFALRYLELHPGPAHAKLLAQALVEMGFRDVAVRVAKVTGYDGPTFPAYAYPVIAVPDYRGPGTAPEPALVHAIIRQETEFDPDSLSHAGARGIMQIMPAGARRNSKLAGLPYMPNRLTSDITYNMQLGMTEFSGYLDSWNNSLVVSAAAYNAGENNVRRWIATFGDPRSPNVDPIDWIEEIPFGETRNYVQRILENLQVYRNRLAGRDQKLRILADLYAPNPPPAGILRYTPPPPVPAPKPPADKH